MGIQRWQPNEGVLLHATRVGWFVSYTDHVAHTAALVQALRHLTASTEYALKVGYKSEDCGDHCGNGCYWCELRSAVEQAHAALDGQP